MRRGCAAEGREGRGRGGGGRGRAHLEHALLDLHRHLLPLPSGEEHGQPLTRRRRRGLGLRRRVDHVTCVEQAAEQRRRSSEERGQPLRQRWYAASREQRGRPSEQHACQRRRRARRARRQPKQRQPQWEVFAEPSAAKVAAANPSLRSRFWKAPCTLSLYVRYSAVWFCKCSASGRVARCSGQAWRCCSCLTLPRRCCCTHSTAASSARGHAARQ